MKKHLLPQSVFIVLLTAIVFFLSLTSVWFADSVGYAFFHPANIEGISYERVSSLPGIWESQVNHYMFTNGRFVCHYLVQMFCGLLPKIWFAAANALVWASLLSLLAGAGIGKKESVANRISLIALAWTVCRFLPFCPAFQINYVWCALANLLLASIFFCKKKLLRWQLILSAVLGFIAGEWNESFSMPVAFSILVYVCTHRFRLTPVQWFSGIAYGIGTLTVSLAPGTLLRLQIVEPGESSIISGLEQVWPYLLLPMAYILLRFLFRRRENGVRKMDAIDTFLITVAISAYLICGCLKFSSGARMLVCPSLAVIILMGRNVLPYIKRQTALAVVLSVSVLVTTWLRYDDISLMNEKYSLIRDRYHASDDGIVVLPDRLYMPEYRDMNLYRMPWVQQERSLNPEKPFLRIYPESLSGIDLSRDTNMLVPFTEQGWILIQSRTHPARFIIEKTMLPGILNKKMSPRAVDFSDKGDIVIDSTPAVKVAVYINQRPYVNSNVIMKQD